MCEMLLMHKLQDECTCVAHLYHGTLQTLVSTLCLFLKYVSLILMYQNLSFESPLNNATAVGCLRYELIMPGLRDTFFYFSTHQHWNPSLKSLLMTSFIVEAKEKYSICGESHHSSYIAHRD